MAVIGKIRQRSGLLIFLIGASIVGFLIMDATNSQFSVLRGGRKDTVGVVDGEKITYNEFSKKLEENTKNFEDQMRGQPIGDEQRNYVRTQTWTEMVNDIIFNKVYEKLGINVTPDEMTELAMGENASPYLKQDKQFQNPQTGQFDPNQVRMYLSRLDQDPEGVEPGTVRKQWMRFETMLKQSQFQTKYTNLIAKGMYAPTWMGEMSYNDQNRLVSFKYIQLSYLEVNDNDAKVTDDDFKKYLNEHAARFKQDEETRKISYVTFDILPSGSDSAKALQYLLDKRDEFAKGAKPSDDSLYVKMYSETPFDDVYYDKDKLTSPVKDSLFLVAKGGLVGPYVDGNQYKLAKVSDKKMISDSVRVRDIRVSFAGVTSQDAAREKYKLVDSIYRAIDSLKADFGALAAAYSDEPMSKAKGGDIGWVKQGEKEKSYNDVIFYRAVKGKPYIVLAAAENAIHIVEVTEEKPSKMGLLVTYLSREIAPSPETERNIYGTATTFAADNQSEAKFKASGEKLHAKTVNMLKKDAFSIEGLGNARDIVKWAFNAKKGEVSSVFTVENKHVVAMVEQIRPKGLPELDAVREVIRGEVVKKKKGEILVNRINDAKAANIDDLAGKLGKTVAEAEKLSFSNPGLNGGYEAKVVATALATPVGKLSGGIEGNSGVFAIQTTGVQEPAKAADYSVYTFQMKQQFSSKSRYAQDVQKKLAKIEDNRFDFF